MSGVSFIFYFSEIASDPIEIACAHWPEAVPLGDVRTLGLGWLDKAVAKHPGALLWFTGGIPCKDVSQLNARRNGAPGKHSGLHGTVREIPEHLFKLSKNAVCTLECSNGREPSQSHWAVNRLKPMIGAGALCLALVGGGSPGKIHCGQRTQSSDPSTASEESDPTAQQSLGNHASPCPHPVLRD